MASTTRNDFAASEAQLRRLLVADAHREEWVANLGAVQYRELRQLVLKAQRVRPRRGLKVYLLPGVMGSRLGYRRAGARVDTVLWIDPEQIQRGGLLDLALPGRRRCRALGVMVLNYLKLKLTLEIAGFDVAFHAYDWRQDIATLGRELHRKLKRERARSIALVAHSMGGLVARAAMTHERGRSRISRLIMLATPNSGSFAPLMALRGVYPAVRKMATLDPRHSAETLTQKVFSTFEGLYDMLPAPWLDARHWPRGSLTPRTSLLKNASRRRAALAPPDERFSTIVGVGQETVTDAVRSGEAFEYLVTPNGDSTVPLEMAVLPGARTYYIVENHSAIQANKAVCAAVGDLLKRGTTQRLRQSWRTRTEVRTVSEAALRQTDVAKHDWAALSPEERRRLLAGLVLPRPTTPA